MKYLSLFSGIGGFELGIQQAYEICNANRSQNRGSKENKERNERQGLQPKTRKEVSTEKRPVSERNNNITNERPLCVGFSEIDKYATEIYQKHFPNHKEYGDITKINEKELPDFDLLVGGFPCQAFSIAGKRRGFEDTRGTMFFEIARIVREKQPRLLLLENVKGLLSHDQGRTFTTIIATLDELGYDLQWQVLNSKNHGVPQNRERIFIIGHLRGTPRPQVFPFTQGSKSHLKYSGGVISAREQWLKDGKHNSRNFSQGQRIYSTDGISQTLAGNAGGQGGKTGLYETGDTKIRRLTPTECERLQGFPDGWTEDGLSDTMEICVNTKNVKEKRLLELDTVSNITSDGKGMVIPIYQNENKNNVNIVVEELLQEAGVINTINRGNAMATLFNRKGILQSEEQIKQNLISERMVEKSTFKLWKVRLEGHYEEEKLSTILTWINEIMMSITSISARTDENIIGVITVLNSLEQNSLNKELSNFKVGNISSISDTQRYKTLGNAVTVNVIRDICKELLCNN